MSPPLIANHIDIDPESDSPNAPKAKRLIDVAREIIRERGDFDLPMRELASRAKVSLRFPYEHFGSKAGVIRAILKADQAAWAAAVKTRARHGDAFDDQFRQLKLGVAWFGREVAFYRALFQASQAFSGGDEADASRENQAEFLRWVKRAIRDGLIDPQSDPELVSGALTDVFAANMRVWALTGCDLGLVEARISYGVACVLSAVAVPPHEARMRQKALELQAVVARRSGARRRTRRESSLSSS